MKDRTRRSWLGLALAGCLLSVITGCSRMSGQRVPATPPLLGRLMRPEPAPDPTADHYAEVFKRHEAALASRTTDRPDSLTMTRSTAAPSEAYLPAPPIAVALDPPPAAGESDWLENLPPPSATPAGAGVLAAEPQPATGTTPRTAVAPSAPPLARSVEPAPPSSPPEDPLATLRQVVEASRRKLNSIQTYQLRMQRQEQVGGVLQAEEEVLLSIRRDPRAVRLEWTEGPSKGREVLYAAAPAGSGLMHVNMPNNPLMPRISLPPDSPLALQNSRHPISEAGLDAILSRVEEALKRQESGASGTERLSYEGLVNADSGGPRCHRIVRVTPTGETWVVLIDERTLLPFLVEGKSASGELMERYVFRDARINLPDLAAAGAFDPEARWGPTKSLFGRLARAVESSNPPAGGTQVR